MNLFFELLQVSLGTRDELSRVPSVAEWGELLEEARRQTVVGVMLDGMERLPAEQRPSKAFLLQWIGVVQMMEATCRLHHKRARELTERFRSVGFRSCILKGLSAAKRYPIPLRRQCGDIDLWVEGDRKELMAWLRSQCEIGLVTWHHIDAKLFNDVEVEVHLHPNWLYNPWHNTKMQRWFAEQQPIQMGQEPTAEGFVATTAEFDVVYQLTHMFHHLLEEGIGVRHVVDYYYALREFHKELRSKKEEGRCKKEDVGGLKDDVRGLRDMHIERFAGAMMYVLQKMCGASAELLLCEPDEKEGKFLLNEIMAGGNFGQTRQDGKVRNSFSRWIMMVKHYPSEVLWMIPWKIWHYFWRFFHN